MHKSINCYIFISGPGALKHLFNVGLDLRKLGLATEFGLQIANEFSEKKLPQYNLNLHVNKENDKYHFHVYSQPEPGREYFNINLITQIEIK